MSSRSPSDWSLAQREFHERYITDCAALPRCHVRWRRYDESAMAGGLGSRGAPLAAAVMAIRAVFGKRNNEAPVVALWTWDAKPGATAILLFEFEPWPSTAEGEADLVGEATPNGALCLELATGDVVWPTYNPRRPSGWLPRL
jgi:hypothetical protein